MARTDDSLLAKADETAGQLAGQLALPMDPVELAIPEPLVAIPVRGEAPAQAIARCVALSAANPVLPLLPQDPRRRRAVLLAVDADVYVANSLELAQNVQGSTSSAQGFYLPKGVPVEVTAKAAFWAAYTTLGQSLVPATSFNAAGNQTAPGAFASLGTVNLPNGIYQVSWSVGLSGTPGAADANNFELYRDGLVQVMKSVNPGAVGTYPQVSAVVQVTAGVLGVLAIGAGVAGSVYAFQLAAVPLSVTGSSARVSVLVEKDDE